MGRLVGKVVVVTGGGKGIGKAACIRLAEEGARVAVADLDENAGSAMTEEIRAAGGEAVYCDLDVGDETHVRIVFDEVHDQFGRIDVLVNNAGIAGANKPTHELTD